MLSPDKARKLYFQVKHTKFYYMLDVDMSAFQAFAFQSQFVAGAFAPGRGYASPSGLKTYPKATKPDEAEISHTGLRHQAEYTFAPD